MGVFCSEIATKGTVTAGGSGNFNSIAYNGCHAKLFLPGYTSGTTYEEPVTVTAMSGWNFQISKTEPGSLFTSFSNFLMRVALTNHPECSIDIGGTFKDRESAGAGGGSISRFAIGIVTEPENHLTVTRSSGCARTLEMGEVGESITGAGALSVSPVIRVTS
jgi:hypothetical protein